MEKTPEEHLIEHTFYRWVDLNPKSNNFLEGVIDAMQAYAKQEAENAREEGFKAARERQRFIEGGEMPWNKYRTYEDYLNSQKHSV